MEVAPHDVKELPQTKPFVADKTHHHPNVKTPSIHIHEMSAPQRKANGKQVFSDHDPSSQLRNWFDSQGPSVERRYPNLPPIQLLRTNAHIGRRAAAHHFKVYIFGSRNGIAILDSDKTLICLRNAWHFMGSPLRKKGHSLLKKTNPLVDEIMEEMASCINDSQWRIGAFLTNSCSSPKKFRSRKKKINLGSNQQPDCVLILYADRKSSVILEADRSQIPIASLVDSTIPSGSYKRITYPIPANAPIQFFFSGILQFLIPDDLIKSVSSFGGESTSTNEVEGPVEQNAQLSANANVVVPEPTALERVRAEHAQLENELIAHIRNLENQIAHRLPPQLNPAFKGISWKVLGIVRDLSDHGESNVYREFLSHFTDEDFRRSLVSVRGCGYLLSKQSSARMRLISEGLPLRAALVNPTNSVLLMEDSGEGVVDRAALKSLRRRSDLSGGWRLTVSVLSPFPALNLAKTTQDGHTCHPDTTLASLQKQAPYLERRDFRLRDYALCLSLNKTGKSPHSRRRLQEIRLGSRPGYLLESLSVVLILIPTLCVALIRKKRMRASTGLTTPYWKKWSIPFDSSEFIEISNLYGPPLERFKKE
ncbi:ribosomal protein S2, mitochondrial [Canna indica]|uniref:Ribosomal protein S2, mitochondrial n=1 Tax=Canna indica TaxID=4628 RepID=A0AAQ3Q9X3_9LILI|nr:ribosomal protein S2, mitochondrial [Canna indica]